MAVEDGGHVYDDIPEEGDAPTPDPHAMGGFHATKKDGSRRKPKATKEEMREILHIVYGLLAGATPKHVVKHVLKQTYYLSASRADQIISRARKMMREAIEGKDVTDHKADAYHVYREVLSSPAATNKDKIFAQNSIDRLLGLLAPVRIAETDAQGNDKPAMSVQQLRELALQDDAAREAMLVLAERLAGFKAPPAQIVVQEEHSGPGARKDDNDENGSADPASR